MVAVLYQLSSSSDNSQANASRTNIQSIPDTLWTDGSEDQGSKFHVGIVGAGCAGLFTAMIFDYLNENHGLEVTYDILEANEEKRLGGRLYTHHFTPEKDHLYYDVGGMRFPDNPMMQR